MPRKSQRKGRQGEDELSELLNSYGYNTRPGSPLNYGTEPDIVGLPDIHIECKRAEVVRMEQWIQQAETDSKRFNDGLPAVFHRKNRQPWYVTMKLADWLELYRRKNEGS